MGHILVVDDNTAVCTALRILFELHGLDVECVESPQAAVERVARGGIDLVVQDMNFSTDTTSGEEGVALFGELRRIEPDLPVVLLTAWTHLETAVELVKQGAADYLAKPWDDDRLVVTARNLLALGAATRSVKRLSDSRRAARERLAREFDLRGIIYDSDSMHEVVTLATRVAHADVPVLLTGPNGAGKEMIADIIQANSAVRDGPYVKVNVGALPADLLESELFGAEAGAYTGAQKARMGRFEAADGGTLFLDELGTLPPEGQIKLLRVLQTGEFQRLGSSETRRASVRVISATNADPERLIRDGRFREDLYYRLNVIEIDVPPLTERRDDILPLARAFAGAGHSLAPDAEAALLAHDWPGNVRELANCLRRATLLSRSERIVAGDLGLPTRRASSAIAGAVTEADGPDRASVESALEKSGGIVARAAAELGLSRQALYRRMEKLGLKA
jgi:DNA-binding NtrC family response regulator